LMIISLLIRAERYTCDGATEAHRLRQRKLKIKGAATHRHLQVHLCPAACRPHYG
jgi:hypothetical protein